MIAVGGTSIPKTIVELSKKKITTIFIDGDRGGELILKESLQRCEIDYIARAPKGKEVEELSKKEVLKYLRLRVPVEQYLQQLNRTSDVNKGTTDVKREDDVDVPVKVTENTLVDSETNREDRVVSNKEVLTYKVLKSGDHELQLRYIRSSIEEIRGTNKIKIMSPNFEKVLSVEELSEDLLSNVSFVISDAPITQRMIDRFFNGVNSNLVIIGREIYITKKPSNLKILKYEDVI